MSKKTTKKSEDTAPKESVEETKDAPEAKDEGAEPTAKEKMDALIASRRPEVGVAYQQGKPVKAKPEAE